MRLFLGNCTFLLNAVKHRWHVWPGRAGPAPAETQTRHRGCSLLQDQWVWVLGASQWQGVIRGQEQEQWATSTGGEEEVSSGAGGPCIVTFAPSTAVRKICDTSQVSQWRVCSLGVCYDIYTLHVSATDPILSRPCQLLLPTLILWGMVEEHPTWLPNCPDFTELRLPLRVTHQQQPYRVSRLSRGQARQCQAPERPRRTWARPCASSVYPRRSRERTSGHRDKTLECLRTLRRLSGVLWGPAMGIWKEVGRWQCD